MRFTGDTPEFMQLTTWERDCSIFHRVSELSVFKDYKKWRSFLVWRGVVRRHAMNSSQNFLQKNLFHVHPKLSATLQLVRKCCLEFSANNDLYVSPGETLTLEDYCQTLVNHLNTQRESLEKMVLTLRDHVDQACKAAMLAAQMEREQMNSRYSDEDKRKRKLLDIRELGMQQQPSYVELTQRKATCKRLTAFIKLCDYLIISCLTKLAIKAVVSIAADIVYPRSASAEPPSSIPTRHASLTSAAALHAGHHARDRKSDSALNSTFSGPLFSVEVLYNEKDQCINISPSQVRLTEAVDDIISEYVHTARGIPRLEFMDVFKVYTSSVDDRTSLEGPGAGPDVAEMILAEEEYKKSLLSINNSFAYCFNKVNQYVHGFNVYRDMYVSNAKLDMNVILEQQGTIKFFREHLMLFKNQMDMISSKIPNSKDVTLFRVHSDGLREFFAPSPAACLEAFHQTMPIIVHRYNEALLSELQKRNSYLSAFPKTVEHYVEYLDYYHNLESELDQIGSSFEFIRELLNLLQEESISISENDEEIFRSGTRPQFDKLRTLVQVVEDGKESQQRLFARNIDEQMDQLRRRIEEVYNKAGQPIVDSDEGEVETVITYITDLQQEAERIAAREKELRRFQSAIGVEETTVDTMQDMLNDVNIKARLWVGISDWQKFTDEVVVQPFAEVDLEGIQDKVQKYTMLVKQVITKLTGNAAVPKLKKKVEEWRQLIPILQVFTNPKMKAEHHLKVSNIVGMVEDSASGTCKTLAEWNKQFTIKMLLENNVLAFKNDILAISATAIEEDKLQQQIDKVNAMWNGGGPKPPMEFEFHHHKDMKDVFTLVSTSVEDVAALLDDSLIAISTIGSSRCCQGILRTQVDRWEARLKYMQATLDKWVEFQRNWVYLENIFSSSEIRSQWKDDAKRFEKADHFFKYLMRKAHDLPTAYRVLLINPPSFDPGDPTPSGRVLQQELEAYIVELERVLSSLEKKLEEKRRAFPRLYFLSNDDLLDVLAKVRTPELVMLHMLKIFDGIKTLVFGESSTITHLVSMEDEKVELINQGIKARGPVETWMDILEHEMFTSLRRHAQTCLEDYEARDNRHEWMFQHPVQLVLIMEQLFWTRSVEEALDKQDTPQRMENLKKANYRALEDLASLTSFQLSKLHRILLSTMITIDVHGRDLVDDMCTNQVMDSREFGWTKQLRVYWEPDEDGRGNIFIRQNNSRFVYGYEYLGAQGRLVITPLTDRIYMTVTGALKLYLGTSPQGPAGTGKTETVKDLAKNLARQCIVYNCSDGVTYKMMEKLFSGLIQTGAWACLDEFNRINIEVLSVIASQLLEIKLALQNGQEKFTFQGTPDVRVRGTYGAFATMNPGYAGRTELPDNLKILFRPVAVMTPDFRMIAEVILYSEGFKDAKELSRKITQLYKLSSEKLSLQDHYDFGMRAIKSILVMAGDLKRSQPDVPEHWTLIVACNDANVPKFVAEDLPLFKGIMQDLFPGVSFPEREYHELLPAMRAAMAAKKLLDAGAWLTKAIQFYETLIVRHGVMLVGGTGTGKTEICRCLAEALTSMGAAGSTNPMARPVHQFVINPKAIHLHELYGQLDVNTNEWIDGVLATIMKECVRDSETNKDHRWIIMDGPVDTLWIESLNSVLDDSKLLCLDNGERVKLPDTIHMLFEVENLAVASPATVSRCGMVYINAGDLPWSAVVHQWSETKLEAAGVGPLCRRYILSLFDTFVDRGLRWLQHQTPLISAGEINIVQSMCDLFSAMMQTHQITLMPDPENWSTLEPDDEIFRIRNETCHLLFVFSYIWSVAGNVDQDAMDNFDHAARGWFEKLVRFPNHGSIFDLTVDFSTRMFIPWANTMPEYVYDPATPFFNILVPTVDTVRYGALARMLLRAGKPFLLNGPTGVGKTVILADCLSTHKEALHLSVIAVQFSAQTSAARTQEAIEGKMKQKRKNILVPPPGQQVALFIDDLNLPAREVFGASPPIELLRQLMGHGGFYDRLIAGFWKHVREVTVVAACGPPEGGRNPLTPRLTRLFHLLQIPNLAEKSMHRIFTAILGGFFEAKGFHKDIKHLTGGLVQTSVEVFNGLRRGLRPRPATPHYTFNLRDLAKVFQGITQVTPRACKDAKTVVRLWMHECMRCFYDRLATPEDRRFFLEDLMSDAVNHLIPASNLQEELFSDTPMIWADFMRFGSSERVYEEVTDFKRVPHVLGEYQEEYNAIINLIDAKGRDGGNNEVQAAHLNLVFFKDHCEHLSRLIRILRQPRGNALLVGVGGSGKRSLARLAAYVADCRIFEIAVGKGFSVADFHEFLVEVYTYAGVECRPCVMLLSDNQMVHDVMLEDISNVLNSGEVPSLFSSEEREKKINSCLEEARKVGISNREDVYNFFISRVRDNLHVALCMSPVGDTFRAHCRQFPSLTNCCSIDWLDEWPTEALNGVSENMLKDLDGLMPTDFLSKLPALCVDVHDCVVKLAGMYWEEVRRRYYVTPTSYLEFIEMYKAMFVEQQKTIEEQLERIKNGKLKMKETDETIGKMRHEIEVKRPLLEQASKETQAVVADLKVRQTKVGEMQVQVRAQQASATEQQSEASRIASEANSRLAEAKPIITRAKAALDTIQASDLNELRSFANPPSAVLKTAQACMNMFDPKDFNNSWSGGMDWKGAREFLSYRPLLDMIRNYPTDNVKPSILQKIQKCINDEEFTVEICSQRGSQTCGSLCAWVHAVNEYSKIVKEVAPMRQAAAEAEQHLAETTTKLHATQQLLRDVEKELAELEENYQRSLKKKNDLEAGLRVCIRRLENAETLSSSLKSEGARWSENITHLTAKLGKLPLQSFIASACAAYFGPFTPAFRKRLLQAWFERLQQCDLGADAGGSLIQILGDPVDILSWRVNGLPMDDTSIENAIIAMLSHAPRRWPLFIDPQEQGIKWLMHQFSYQQSVIGNRPGGFARDAKHGQMSMLKVIRMTEPTWMRTLEMQIRLGGVVIIDNVGETLDLALEQLIARRIITREGGMPQIQLTTQSGPIDFHPNFRLFMCTKLANPHFLPDISTRVALINFTITREGLEEQLLGEVVSIEKRELEREKNRMIESISQGERKLKAIEKTILERLNSTKGNILDDSELIAELKAAQSNAEVVGVQQIEANQKMEIISVSREKYRSVAVRASVLFFVIADIACIDPMYQYSLQFFVNLVRHEIENTEKPTFYDEESEGMLQEHLVKVKDRLTETTYNQVCRGLFNRDKIILSVLIVTSIARQKGEITDAEWQYFVRSTALIPSNLPEIPAELKWMNRQQWELLQALTLTVPAYKALAESLSRHAAAWKAFATHDEIHTAGMPDGWGARLTAFQKILLVRTFREEKLYLALYHYVSTSMGARYVETPLFDLATVLQDSTPATPIIFVLSQGADPMGALQACVKAEGRELQYISLGQGQGENAKKLIANCRTTGAWALLQNCHLSKSFMPELESEVAKLQAASSETHPDFRLWLTSMPTDFFPVFVLQTSIKLTNEPPTGLRANMIRALGDLTPKDFTPFVAEEHIGGYSKNEALKKLLYGLCFFHSVVLERRKFGPLGWNVTYEWNDTDLDVSKQWLRLFFEAQEAIPWDPLEYIIGEINYGGRVTDPQDRGLLQTILRRCISPGLLQEGYTFSESGRYVAPAEGSTFEDLKTHILQLPLVDEPEAFGMHENANLRYQLQTSQYLLSTVVSIQPRQVGAGGGSVSSGGGAILTPEEEVRAKCQELAAGLPPNLRVEEAGPTAFVTLEDGLPNSLSTVLAHEVGMYNRLLDRIRQTLADMEKALQGLTVLSVELDAMYTSVLNDQVPQLWAAVAYASLKPLGAWYRDFLQRVNFIRTWLHRGEPKAFWIGGFFNCSAFITGISQAFARAEKVSVDKLGFRFYVVNGEVDQLEEGPERGCYVYGVYADAWRWDPVDQVMSDPLPGEPYAILPALHFLPEPFHEKPNESHAVPLYRTTVRAGMMSSLGASSNYVLSIEFPSDKSSDYWLLKGAACVCALNN
ncbi:unnamed protein product [Phytomonas sp. EM1]|nr:unnamed protein product [Phytomonas sp. EM1]|eukprot:CCW60171.1 unnamed protein product [Phytomonas sp. isolate EM1]